MRKIPADVLVQMAEEIHADDERGVEGFMCLTDAKAEAGLPLGQFGDVLRYHGISLDGDLAPYYFRPDSPDSYWQQRNGIRVWWLLLVAESGVQHA